MCELLISQYLEQVQILDEHESACKQAIYIRTFNPTTGSSVPTTSSSVPTTSSSVPTTSSSLPTGSYFITHGHRIARLEIFSVRFSTVKLYDKILDLLVEIKTKDPSLMMSPLPKYVPSSELSKALLPEYLNYIRDNECHEFSLNDALYANTFSPLTGAQDGRYFLTQGHQSKRQLIYHLRRHTVNLFAEARQHLVWLKKIEHWSPVVLQYRELLSNACLFKIRVLEEELEA
ncbi:hypothetical protein BGX24_007393, partial [Mortierella sp. AD032]